MNFVGKILIVVQIVLSFLFMAFAGAVFTVQTNWKNEAQTLRTQLDGDRSSYEQTITDLNDQNDKLDKDLKAAANDRNRFQAAANALQSQLTQEQEEHRKSREALAQQSEIARVAGDEAEERRKEAKKLRDENERLIAVTDEQAKQLRAKEDQIYAMEQDNKVKARKQIALLRENRDLLDFIASKDLRFDPEEIQAGKTLPPVVKGLVVSTRTDKRGRVELVEISIGSDDGLARGHDLSVYSTVNGRGKYLGEIRLVYITPDKSVGVVLERAKNGIIEKGDNVTTKL